jgi:8-oxo-dGTP diphosphatase
VENLVENIEHIFPNTVVRLLTCEAIIVMGTLRPREHAELRRYKVDDLKILEWASADIPTVRKIVRKQAVK